jgi:hypothetical protein
VFAVQPSPGHSDQERGLLQPVGVAPTWSRLHFWAALAAGEPRFLDDEQNLFLLTEQISPGSYPKASDQFARHDRLPWLRSTVPAKYDELLQSPLRITALIGHSPQYDFERQELRILDASERNVLGAIRQMDVCLNYGEQREIIAALPCLDIPGSFHPAQNSVGKEPDRITDGEIALQPPVAIPRALPMGRDTAEQVIGARHRCQHGITALIDIRLVGAPKIRVRNSHDSIATIVAEPISVAIGCQTVEQDPRSYVRLY